MGMEYRPFYLAREWKKAGHEVLIVAADRSHLRQTSIDVGDGPWKFETHEGVEYLWCKTTAYEGNGFKRVVNMASFVRRLYQFQRWMPFEPDVVIASSTYPLDAYPARRIATRYGAKLVFELHDLWPLSPILLGGHSPRHPFMRLLQHAENFACRKSDLVVSILPNTKEHLVEHGMAPSKFRHIPNGIDLEESVQVDVPLPDGLSSWITQQEEQGRLLVGYAGSIGASNALEYLVQAAARVTDKPLSFVIIGKGAHLDALVGSATSNVFFHAPIPKSAIPSFLSRMDVLYLGWHKHPLYRFGISPNKLMDYMQAGRPVLHSVDAANDLVQSAGCGYSVPPEDPEAISAALSRLLGHSMQEREAMGERGRQYVRTHHDYKNLAAAFLQAVQQTEVDNG